MVYIPDISDSSCCSAPSPPPLDATQSAELAAAAEHEVAAQRLAASLREAEEVRVCVCLLQAFPDQNDIMCNVMWSVVCNVDVQRGVSCAMWLCNAVCNVM